MSSGMLFAVWRFGVLAGARGLLKSAEPNENAHVR